MPGSIESTSPDQRTFKVPPCLAGDLLAVVVCFCAPPQPAAKSVAASDTEIRDLERAISSTDRLKSQLLDCASCPQKRQSVLEGVLGGRTKEWVIPREARVAMGIA